MSDTGDIKQSFVEDENKVNIEATCINLHCIKNEPNEDALNFKKDSHTTQYSITLEYENIFGEALNQRKIEEDCDNLIGFVDNEVIMENAMIKLEAIKEEDDGSFNNSHCRKCKEIYKGFCLRCSNLLSILNNNPAFVNSESESNTIPTDILEIRETSRGKGVYLLRTLPINTIFGPFEGILGIESTVGHSWKIIDKKLRNIKSGNWMKNIVCAASNSLKNLDIFQIDGNLYFQANREITEGEELLIYYDSKKLQQLEYSEGYLYTPQKQKKLPKIFGCTVCCLGFGSNKCLIEHKRKYCPMEHSKSLKDFVLIECHYCKMWLEKWEHEEYHVTDCLAKYHRMLEAVDRGDRDVEEMKYDYGTKTDKSRYQRDICSSSYDRTNDLKFDTKDHQCFSGVNHETSANNEQIQNNIETNTKSNFQNPPNKHRGIKPFQCDICMVKFTRKSNLKTHTKNKHSDTGREKNYKCSHCSYQTNYKSDLQKHLHKHIGIQPFQCDICMVKFTRRSSLKTHLKNKHSDTGSGKDYKCIECAYQTNYKTDLQKHLNTHTGIKPFKCDICMKQFGQKAHLNTHIENRHAVDETAKDYKYSVYSYETNDECLKLRINNHGYIKQFQCDICVLKFTRKDSLKRHIKDKHANNGCAKDYKCLECSYQTNYKANLEKHVNKHRGIKQFQCDICKQKFTQKGHLKLHIKNKHSDNGSGKDYKCSDCSYQTNYRSNLQVHLNKKHTYNRTPVIRDNVRGTLLG